MTYNFIITFHEWGGNIKHLIAVRCHYYFNYNKIVHDISAENIPFYYLVNQNITG